MKLIIADNHAQASYWVKQLKLGTMGPTGDVRYIHDLYDILDHNRSVEILAVGQCLLGNTWKLIREIEDRGYTVKRTQTGMNKKKVTVYVAGPYTKGDVAVNVRNALDAANLLVCAGFYPFVPHLSHFWHMVHPRPYEFWMDYDSEFLKVCDCVLRLRGDSNGADEETTLAHQLGIRIFYAGSYGKLESCINDMTMFYYPAGG